METFAILRQLNHVRHRADFAPYEAALRAAVEQRESITPELIVALDRVSADPVYYMNNRHDSLHLFAIYLLAEFRESRALDSFLRFFSLPGEQSLELTGDMITDHGAAVLASVCAGDPAPLLQLALDESVNEFVRQQAIDGLLVQFGWNERPRDAVIENLRRLFHTLPKPGNAYVWASLVGAVCDFPAPELISEARQAFAEELVDETVIGPDALDEIDSHGLEMFPRPHGEQRFSLFYERNAPICAVDECSAWVGFRDEQAEDEDGDELDVDDEDPPDDGLRPPPPEFAEYVAPQPYIAPPKTGRNEPCPCGSGKKYKKCCGNK